MSNPEQEKLSVRIEAKPFGLAIAVELSAFQIWLPACLIVLALLLVWLCTR